MEGHQYTSKRLPGGIYRVVDRKNGHVEGVWNPHDKTWLDIRGWLYD